MGIGPYPRAVSELPAGYVVTVEPGDRIHFQDWEGPPERRGGDGRGVLLVHGLSQTSWIWAPIARRLAASVPTIAMDLRGHGLSDAPTEPGAYDLEVLAEDVVAVAEGSGLLVAPDAACVLAGHGFGAMVATAAAGRLGPRCAALVLVDGGWGSMEAATGMDVEEFLRGLDEPPEVMASLTSFLADRRGFDPSTWDEDQDRAARATVVETHAGRVVPATRPHALEACVRTMFAADPVARLEALDVPVVALLAADDERHSRAAGLAFASDARTAAGHPPIRVVSFGQVGHNLMRYRPAEVADLILSTIP